MAKLYKYRVVLETHIGTASSIEKITIELDHPYSVADAIDIERNNTGLFETCGVVNVTLDSITGDFHYHVVFETHSSLTDHFQHSCLCTLNHQVTAATYQKDIAKFISQFMEEDVEGAEDSDDSEISVLSFMEIPD